MGSIAPQICQFLTHVILLSWKSTNSHPGRIGFNDAVDPADVRGGHTEAGADAADGAVRRRDERVRP